MAQVPPQQLDRVSAEHRGEHHACPQRHEELQGQSDSPGEGDHERQQREKVPARMAPGGEGDEQREARGRSARELASLSEPEQAEQEHDRRIEEKGPAEEEAAARQRVGQARDEQDDDPRFRPAKHEQGRRAVHHEEKSDREADERLRARPRHLMDELDDHLPARVVVRRLARAENENVAPGPLRHRLGGMTKGVVTRFPTEAQHSQRNDEQDGEEPDPKKALMPHLSHGAQYSDVFLRSVRSNHDGQRSVEVAGDRPRECHSRPLPTALQPHWGDQKCEAGRNYPPGPGSRATLRPAQRICRAMPRRSVVSRGVGPARARRPRTSARTFPGLWGLR